MPDPTPTLGAARASSPAESVAQRRAAHTDTERDRARGRLRVAQAEVTRAEPVYWKAVKERYEAADHGFNVGLTVREIGRLLGNIPSGHVHRMREKVRGGDMYAARRYDRSQARVTRAEREDTTP